MFLMWHDSYSVGYGPIDVQHQYLFSISNALTQANEKPEGATDEYLRSIVEELLAYARTHFADEEQLMSRAEYPDLEEHKKLHIAFENKMCELEERIRNGEVRAVAAELPLIVNDWLLDHITTVDQRYAGQVQSSLGTEKK